jgi:hypothetical protein
MCLFRVALKHPEWAASRIIGALSGPQAAEAQRNEHARDYEQLGQQFTAT